jgi:hypothetical protein
MTKNGSLEIKRGQAITFRIPSDTSDHILKQLQKLKETEKRNFSSKIAEFALEGVGNTLSRERETISIPLPRQLSKEQRNWLKHSHSEALLGSIVYQLLVDPLRATSVLASLSSNSLDINEALYLQESSTATSIENTSETVTRELKSETVISKIDEVEDDLMSFDLEKARQELSYTIENVTEDKEESAEELLGDFLAQMNK